MVHWNINILTGILKEPIHNIRTYLAGNSKQYIKKKHRINFKLKHRIDLARFKRPADRTITKEPKRHANNRKNKSSSIFQRHILE